MPRSTPANGHSGQRPGRPSKYNPTTAGKILAALRNGSPRAAACAYAEIHPTTFYDWLRDRPEFALEVSFAEGKCEVLFCGSIAKAAENGDWRAAAFWLTHRRREDWHQRQEFNIQPAADTDDLSPEELNRRVRQIYGFNYLDDKPTN